MNPATVAAAILIVAGGTAVLSREPIRSALMSVRWPPWSLHLPLVPVAGFWLPLLPPTASRDVPVSTGIDWEGAQLLLVSDDGDTLLLDCVVPTATTGGRGASVPVVLRTHHPAGARAHYDEGMLAVWADELAVVDISMRLAGNAPVVLLSRGAERLRLVLDRVDGSLR